MRGVYKLAENMESVIIKANGKRANQLELINSKLTTYLTIFYTKKAFRKARLIQSFVVIRF